MNSKGVVVESSVRELREMLARRDDVPVDFSRTPGEHPRAQFREYRDNWEHRTWETERDSGALYPSDDSYTPYLEP